MAKDWLHEKDRKRINDLGYKGEIHHHPTGEIVICEGRSYHMLLHRRTDALKTCGHADWRKCTYCGEYDSLDNLTLHRVKGYEIDWTFHDRCKSKRNKERRLERQLEALAKFASTLK